MKNQQFWQQLPHEVTHRLMSKALNTLSITDCIILSLLTVTHLPFPLIPPSLRLCHHGLISSSRPPLSYGLSAHTFNVMIFSSQWFSITKRWPDLFAKAFFPNLSRYEAAGCCKNRARGFGLRWWQDVNCIQSVWTNGPSLCEGWSMDLISISSPLSEPQPEGEADIICRSLNIIWFSIYKTFMFTSCRVLSAIENCFSIITIWHFHDWGNSKFRRKSRPLYRNTIVNQIIFHHRTMFLFFRVLSRQSQEFWKSLISTNCIDPLVVCECPCYEVWH